MELEQQPKFTDLRIRTDQRLFGLLLREFDRALAESARDETGEDSRLDRICRISAFLVPTMEGLSERQRAYLKQRIDEGRGMLGRPVRAAAVA